MPRKILKKLLIRARNISDSHFVIILIVSACILMGIEAITFSIFRSDPDNQKDFLITTNQDDYLIYTNDHHLYFYNPVEDSHQPILPDWHIDFWDTFSISKEDRLAFSSSYSGGKNIYFLDYPYKDGMPVKITSDTSVQYYQMTWSLDGQYLAIESNYDDAATLSIWDGNTNSQVFHSPEHIGDLSWSPDGRLTFTEFDLSSSSDEIEDDSEIFIWDGNETVNLSQNPSGTDRSPVWNIDGQLAFLSEREGKYGVYIWDGTSEKNGLPDMNTIKNIAPNLTNYGSYPIWTNSGSLSFGGSGLGDSNVQIYEWDGGFAANRSKNPDFHNGGQTWRSDGYWAFTTFFSSEQLLYVRDEKNRTIFTVEGQYRPAWGQSGRLIFCVPERSGWRLSMWDGMKVVEIAQSYDIDAQWRNGEGVSCSHG